MFQPRTTAANHSRHPRFRPHKLKLHAPQKSPFTSKNPSSISCVKRAAKHVVGRASSVDTNPHHSLPKHLRSSQLLIILRISLGCSAQPTKPSKGSYSFLINFVSTHFAKHRGVHSKWRASSVDYLQSTFVPILAFQHCRVELRQSLWFRSYSLFRLRCSHFCVLGQLAIMVRFHTLAGALLGLSASAYAAPQQSTPSTKTPPASATATTTNVPAATAPCALAASAQAQYFSAVPNGKLKAGRTRMPTFSPLIGHSLLLSLRPPNVNASMSGPHVTRCTCSYLKFIKAVLSN